MVHTSTMLQASQLYMNKLNNMKTKLYSTIRFLQDADEDYNRVEAVFSGLKSGYCEGNSQPVIDYLSDWDDEDNELTEEIPMIAKMGDTAYADENGVYTLLYNSSIGGCFLLYREASATERQWWNNKR